jgi:hypothetical protein
VLAWFGMYWHLGKSITACIAADRVMFLDTARDRYFAAPSAINDSAAGWLRGDLMFAAAPQAQAFLRHVIGIEGDDVPAEPVPRHVEMPSPFDTALPPSRPIRALTLASVALRVFRAQRDLRRKPLSAVLAGSVARTRSSSHANPELLRSRLRAFHTARPLVPVPRICLHDCLALLDWLGEAGAGTQLVFGVAAYPFAAHSWLQWNGEVIDDHPESVSRFTPILHLP